MEKLNGSVNDRGYTLIDVDLLSCAITESCVCKVCSGALELVENAG